MAVTISPDGVDRYVKNANAPATVAPLMVGCWATSAGPFPDNNCLWCLHNSAAPGAGDLFSIQTGFGFTIGFEVWQQSGNVDQYFGVSLTPVANAWYYILARSVAANNNRLSVLCPDGSIVHAADTTSSAPGNVDSWSIGTYEPGAPGGETGFAWDGNIAELFVATCDIQPDGGQTLEWLLRKLAYEGPFSLPHIVPSITEYRSFRNGVFGLGRGDNYGAKNAALTASTEWPRPASHPPLSPNYARPSDGRLLLTI